MIFAWARSAAAVAAMTAVVALAGCNRGPATADETAEVNARAAQFFLSNNAKAEGIRTLPSGVQYKVLNSGPPGGESPDSNDLVRVEYEGSLTDGTVFDSSYERGQPAVFTLGRVVEGWTEALQHMKVGDEWVVYLPPEKGYGEEGQGPIPPNSVLVFRLKLLDIARSPGGNAGVGSANG